jgi:DNA-binding transcriptional LysR family regulator
MDSLAEAVGLAQATSAGQLGTLRRGFTSSVVFSPMPAIIAAYRRASPGVEVVLAETSTSDQLERIATGDLDAGFVRQYRPRADLERIRILREPFMAVVPEAHPLGRERHVQVAALGGEPFVHFPRRDAPDLYDEMVRMCAAAGFAPRVVQTASQWVTIVTLVEAGVGVSLVPRALTRIAWPGVRFLPIKPAGRPAEVFAVFPVPPSAAAAGFRSVLERTLEEVMEHQS